MKSQRNLHVLWFFWWYLGVLVQEFPGNGNQGVLEGKKSSSVAVGAFSEEDLQMNT